VFNYTCQSPNSFHLTEGKLCQFRSERIRLFVRASKVQRHAARPGVLDRSLDEHRLCRLGTFDWQTVWRPKCSERRSEVRTDFAGRTEIRNSYR
jgi:hypothetical protein